METLLTRGPITWLSGGECDDTRRTPRDNSREKSLQKLRPMPFRFLPLNVSDQSFTQMTARTRRLGIPLHHKTERLSCGVHG